MSSNLFGATVPAQVSLSDGVSLNLGTRFTPSVDGTITHGRYYMPTTNSGVAHQIAVYRVSTQALLGSASFPAVPVFNAWNTVAFASPIPVSAGVEYIVVCFCPSHYVHTAAYGWPFTSGDLTASATNGWFEVNPAPTYPSTASPGAGSYFADVIFEPAGGGGTTSVTSTVDLRWAVRNRITKTLDLRWVVQSDAAPVSTVSRRATGSLAEWRTQCRLTKAFIAAAPSDIILLRRTRTPDGAGGTEVGSPVPVETQRMRLLPQEDGATARTTADGESATPEYMLMAEHDCDMARFDEFTMDGRRYQVVYIDDRHYEVKGEVIYLGN